jgi:hypothetical protein
MSDAKYAATRTDSYRSGSSSAVYIGKTIREIVRMMIEEGTSWQLAADAVGLSRKRAFRALHKPHVIAYRLAQRKRFIELLSVRVPHKLNELMDSENHAAACRAALALEDMNQQGNAEPVRRIQTGGIVIVLGAPTQQALPAESAMPVIEHEPVDRD